VLSASLEQLGTDYVDLWLIHWPPDGGPRADMWEAFIEARREGLARSIGVSNYSTAQIDALVEATGVTPALDQIPWAPSLYDPARAGELDERDVVLEGYSPLKRSSLADPVVVEIARAHGATAAQVVLRWHIEHGVVAIPKSASPERQAENLAAYDLSLSAEEVERLDGLGRRQR
jgi:diketogulonate reductase-like aldo/keto reductase